MPHQVTADAKAVLEGLMISGGRSDLAVLAPTILAARESGLAWAIIGNAIRSAGGEVTDRTLRRLLDDAPALMAVTTTVAPITTDAPMPATTKANPPVPTTSPASDAWLDDDVPDWLGNRSDSVPTLPPSPPRVAPPKATDAPVPTTNCPTPDFPRSAAEPQVGDGVTPKAAGDDGVFTAMMARIRAANAVRDAAISGAGMPKP